MSYKYKDLSVLAYTTDVPQALLLLVNKVEGCEVTVQNMTGKQEKL